MTNPSIEEIVRRLSGELRASIIGQCACGSADELVALGLWELEPGHLHTYYAQTPLGDAVRAALQANTGDEK